MVRALEVVGQVGVEDTGSDGGEPTRHLFDQRTSVLEVARLNRQARQRLGKTAASDAEIAARLVLADTALTTAQDR